MATIVSSHTTQWRKSTVADVALPEKGSIRTGPFGSQLLHSEFVNDGVAVLGIDNVVSNEFRWGKQRFITDEKFQQLARYQVRPGDVLITIMGTCGRCAIVPDDIPTAINTKHLCCISLDQQQCMPQYLHAYFLYHPTAREYLGASAKGAIMAGLNMAIIKDLPLLLPPLVEQRQIVRRLDEIQGRVASLESISEKKNDCLQELPASLLDRAFSGNL